MSKEVDIGIINRSQINYYTAVSPNKYQFHYKANAHDAYFLYMLLTPDKKHLLPIIESAIQKTKKSREWRDIVKSYGMDNHVQLWELEIEELLEVQSLDQ